MPRWHDSRVGFSQTKWKHRKKVDIQQEIQDIEVGFSAWSHNKSVPIAMELAEKIQNFDVDLPSANTVLREYLLRNQEKLSPEALIFLNPDSQPVDSTNATEVITLRSRIKKLKRRLRISEVDPLAWHDLAYNYSILNEDEKADRCLKVAMKLSKNHPFVARSFSRFLVHRDDPEMAARTLSKIDSKDPSIVSAELAIRARFGIGKPNFKLARSLIDRHESTPGVISELAASLATIDFEVGYEKRARKYMQTALLDQTENVEAQFRWLIQQFNLELPSSVANELRSPEATAIDVYERNQLADCRLSLIDVYDFQPFSAGSLVDAAFMSIAIGDNDFVVSMFEKYNFALSGNHKAQNNLAVALILKGELEKAAGIVDYLDHAPLQDDRTNSVLLATRGLLQYRLGNPTSGRQLYDAARKNFSGSDKKELDSLASVFQASEEIKVDRSSGIAMLERAEGVALHSTMKRELLSFSNLIREEHDFPVDKV